MVSAFLPGRVATAHIETVAKHLLRAAAKVGEIAGLLTSAAAQLAKQLGEFWRPSLVNIFADSSSLCCFLTGVTVTGVDL